ncbi:S-layer homology domain-containing protein [Paenibacillus puerhi]|uniref:S-layer homology domain-containing protein n=1 Tax=Paenibacillus puerhi TaxID=2692622 RepID=UPI001F2126E5|nr:S-layer homology domain-containing protein [Paenibacillus puerhi]
MIVVLVMSFFSTAAGEALAQIAGEPEGMQALAAPGVTEAVYVQSADGAFKLPVQHININVDAAPQKNNYVALFTSGAQVTNSQSIHEVYVKKTNTAIAVDEHDQVIRVIGPTTVPVTGTGWEESQQLPIPSGGYVLLANDSSWGSSVCRKPLFEHFKLGDVVSLHKGDDVVHAGDFLNPAPELQVRTASGTTVTSPAFTVAGQIVRYTTGQGITVTVNGAAVELNPDGSFQSTVQLMPGLNSIAIMLLKNQAEVDAAVVTVTCNSLTQPSGLIEVEAAPVDITIHVEGPRHVIDYIDHDISGIDDTVALFTNAWGSSITIPQFNVAVQVDATNKVLSVVNPSIHGSVPAWTGPTELAIPAGGYVLVAQDTSYASKNFKKYLATSFKTGDTIKLRKNGLVVPVSELMSTDGPAVRLTLDNYAMYTETSASTVLSGTISHFEEASGISLTVNGTPIPIGADGRFRSSYSLVEGINYLDLIVTRDGKKQDTKSLVIFSRPGFSAGKEVILWVDQAANARKFQTGEHVRQFLQTAKDHGVTSVVFDVKGVEGFASYKQSTLTHRPYVSGIRAPEKAGSNPDLDLLEEFVRYSRELGLDIHAAFNIFAEGSIASQEYALLNDHLDWEERVYAAADNGQIKRLRESGKQGAVAFVNPSHDGVRDFQLKTIEEVLLHYDVDGVVLDRARYDNEAADFSDLTREKFEAFLAGRGKQLQHWPTDVFRYVQNVRVDGPLIQDWWEFRAKTIQSFTSEVRTLADQYTAKKGKRVQVSAYVGSWFESYYLNGVHWGSPNFRYDDRLRFKDTSLYTPGYYESAYVNNLDFIMIGAYQTTAPEVEHYITLGNIVTNGEVPLYAGIALTNVQDPALQREVFQSGLNNTHGLMLFDASQVNWQVAGAALKNLVYVRDYQLGISLPGQPDAFLEGSYYNANVIENNIGVLTDAFGYSTGNSRFGVEAVVDGSGKVTRVANQAQALNWSWSRPEETNSEIPQGGFVVSAMDPSGIRTKRQLVARSYTVGDSVRAAALGGFLPYDKLKTGADSLALSGTVKVLGPGAAVVTVNGEEAAVSPEGSFQATLSLQPGTNTAVIVVKVDGFKTNEKTITVIRDEQAMKKLLLTPERINMKPGERTQLSAKAEYAAAAPDVTRQAVYASTEPGVVSVDEAGQLTALKEGTSVIQAVYEGHRAAAEVRVTAADMGSGTDGDDDADTDADSGSDSGSGSGSIKGAGASANAAGERTRTVRRPGEEGRMTSIVTVDAAVLKKELDALAGQREQELRYDVPGNDPAASVALPGALLRTAAEDAPGLLLVISSHLGSYELPVGLLQGRLPREGDFELMIGIGEAGAGTISKLSSQAADEGVRLRGMPVSFDIEVQSAGQTKKLQDLNGYTKRTLKLQVQAADPNRMAVARAGHGSLVFMPARFEKAGGTQIAVIHDRSSNGIYAVAVSSEARFTDLDGHWSQLEVERLASKRIVEGMSANSFSPDGTLTRAQFVMLLTRALGLDTAEVQADFTDIASDAWYAGAVGAAMKAQLVEGFDDGGFRPDAVITREQLSVMVMRALKLTGSAVNPAPDPALLDGFADRGSLAGWAQEAAAQAVEAGLMEGRESGEFAPQDTTTRAEGAVVLRRLLQKAGFVNESPGE